MSLVIELAASDKSNVDIVDSEYIKVLSAQLNDFVKTYSEAGDQLTDQIVNPFLLQMMGKKTLPMSAIFLVGKPGVGKTKFVNTIAEKLGAKMYEFTHVKKDDFISYRTNAKDQYKKLSVFTKIALENDGKPVILFIDEFDKNLNPNLLNTMLEILSDPKTRKIREKNLRLNIRVPSNVMVMCASNTTLEDIAAADKTYVPLLSRFVQINIPDMTKELQIQVSLDYIRSIYPDVTEKDEEFIISVVNKTKHAGMRELLSVINTYTTFLASYKELSAIEGVYVKRPTVYRDNYMKELDRLDQIELNKLAAAAPPPPPPPVKKLSKKNHDYDTYGSDYDNGDSNSY